MVCEFIDLVWNRWRHSVTTLTQDYNDKIILTMQKVSSIKTHCNTAQYCFSSGRHHRCSIEPVWLVRTATSDWERQRRLGRLRLQSLITGAETLDRRASGGRTRGGAERSGGLTGRADRTRCDPMRFLGAMLFTLHSLLASQLVACIIRTAPP